MKNLQQILKRQAGIVGMMCLLIVLASSCRKDRYYYVGGPGDGSNQPAAYLSVVNASTDAPAMDFYLDPNRVNANSLRYNSTLDYFAAYTGKRTAIFYASGSRQKLASDTLTLKNNNNYTLFLSNLISKPDFLVLNDTLGRPASGKAAIRFVNVSPDAPAVDFAIKSGSVLAANRAYKGFSSFIPVTGNVRDTLEIRRAGTTTVLVSISNASLRTGAIYTVWLHGSTAATDNTRLSADILTNASY